MKKEIKNIEKKIKLEWKNIIFNCIFALLTILLPILFYKRILLATVLSLSITVIGLIKWKSKLTLVIFLFGAVWGAVSEMTAINFGVWNYSYTNFMNIPTWLFIAWGNASVFLYQTALEFHKLGVKK